MGQVYHNATLTISAMASTGSREGILKCLLPSSSPYRATLPLMVDNPGFGEVIIERYDLLGEDLNKLNMSGPLSARGWTLQELVLSPRHLFYGAHQIFWKCSKGYRGADGLSIGFGFPFNEYGSIKSILSQTISSPDIYTKDIRVGTILRDYYLLVQDYSHRRLTDDSDKLPALSGIVQKLHQALSGMWCQNALPAF
jgi:hypothetical protein